MNQEIGTTVDLLAARNRKKREILFVVAECGKYLHTWRAIIGRRMILSKRLVMGISLVSMSTRPPYDGVNSGCLTSSSHDTATSSTIVEQRAVEI